MDNSSSEVAEDAYIPVLKDEVLRDY